MSSIGYSRKAPISCGYAISPLLYCSTRENSLCSIADGVAAAGGEAELITVDQASVDALKDASVIALGCPSMGAEQLEETQMEPFMCELDGVIAGKQIALFGSYGWGNQEWMRDWEDRIVADGATVVNGEGIAVNGTPGPDAEDELKALGQTLASL